MLVWDIGKLNPQKLPNLRGSLSMQTGVPNPEENPSLNIDLKIQQLAISGNLSKRDFSQVWNLKPLIPSDLLFIFLDLYYTALLLCAGLKVSRLDMYGEKYKPFKGVKYVTKAGKFQVRTWAVTVRGQQSNMPNRSKFAAPLTHLSNKSYISTCSL